MKFFVPTATDETSAEDLYDAIKKFATENLGQGWKPSNRRIQSVTFRDKGKSVRAEVGKATVNGEVVFAILESTTFLLCTLSRGVKQGEPILVGKHDVESVTDFD